ncbi:hypothetical protein HYT23_01740 [Candidatus Pacearchaeota archaeon]|nr:hypothetical protein [Candidatus Pacearchaeota archaeon]
MRNINSLGAVVLGAGLIFECSSIRPLSEETMGRYASSTIYDESKPLTQERGYRGEAVADGERTEHMTFLVSNYVPEKLGYKDFTLGVAHTNYYRGSMRSGFLKKGGGIAHSSEELYTSLSKNDDSRELIFIEWAYFKSNQIFDGVPERVSVDGKTTSLDDLNQCDRKIYLKTYHKIIRYVADSLFADTINKR